MLKGYQIALKNLDKVEFFGPKNEFTLQKHGNVKNMLKDYEIALKDFHKVDVREPNNAFTL
jgi:hypothetical protein